MGLGDADAGAAAGGLEEERVAQRGGALPRRPRGSVAHSRAVTVTDGITGQAGRLEHDLHVRLVHADRGGEHAGADVPDAGHLEHPLDGAVLAPRPVQQREDHVDLAERLRRLRRLVHDEAGRAGRPGRARSSRGCRRRWAACRRSRSAAGRCHRTPAPSGRRSRCRSGRRRTRSRSMACSTLPAVTHEMPCSLERPPNTTATRGLRLSPGVGSFIPADPTGLVSGHARGLTDPRPVDPAVRPSAVDPASARSTRPGSRPRSPWPPAAPSTAPTRRSTCRS